MLKLKKKILKAIKEEKAKNKKVKNTVVEAKSKLEIVKHFQFQNGFIFEKPAEVLENDGGAKDTELKTFRMSFRIDC